MRKGMLAALLFGVLMLSAPATFAACCPLDEANQGQGDEAQITSGRGAYLGVEVADVNKERAAALKLKEETGVEVTAVDGEAPAAKAGIKEHDVILSINGQKIEGEQQIRRIIRETPPGRKINILISRDGQPMNITTTLASRKNTIWMGKMPKIPPVPPVPPEAFNWSDNMPDVPEVMVMSRTSRIGAMVESITPQLADFFGVKDGAGLLVRSVEKGSIAETAGLRAGDVIVRVEKERVNDIGDWRRMIRSKSGAISIGVVRDKREQNLTVTLPQRKESGELFSDDDEDITQLALLKELPEINAATQKAIEEARKEVEASRGEYEKAMQEARKELEKSMKEQQKDMEKLQKELQKSFHMISYED